MIKEGAMESSGVTDSSSGKEIMISTTARKFFREQFQEHAKTRNVIINRYLADMFSQGAVIHSFKPKGYDQLAPNEKPDETGEVRSVGGGKVIGIVASDHVRILAIKGGISNTLPSVEQGSAPSTGGEVEEALRGTF